MYIYTIYILTTKRLGVVGLQAIEKCQNPARGWLCGVPGAALWPFSGGASSTDSLDGKTKTCITSDVYVAVPTLFTKKRQTTINTDPCTQLVTCIWMSHQCFQAHEDILLYSFIGKAFMNPIQHSFVISEVNGH